MVETYEAVNSFPKAEFLIRMGPPSPLSDSPKYIEQLQRDYLKACHLPLCSIIRGSGNLLSR